ncbi:putative reverse transcriptase domain-containing protein [Abeliophyllum distichum]|uniref:Reverse transcriptase domain-containing protein n=1 Tax=Abeliophyllum distichum TaxID=126358 RepID=A0ABD1Q5E7_9LAMI
MLTSAHILTIPNGNEGFTIYSDTSKHGLGCVLMQHGKLELVKDYDCTISYHPGKANVVADALSRKAPRKSRELSIEVENFNLEILTHGDERLSTMTIRSTLQDGIKKAQETDIFTEKMRRKMAKEKPTNYRTSGKWNPSVQRLDLSATK